MRSLALAKHLLPLVLVGIASPACLKGIDAESTADGLSAGTFAPRGRGRERAPEWRSAAAEARVLLERGEVGAALPFLQDARALVSDSYEPTSAVALSLAAQHAFALAWSERAPEARALLAACRDDLTAASLGRNAVRIQGDLAAAYLELREVDEALDLTQAVLDEWQAELDGGDPDLQFVLARRAEALEMDGQASAAIAIFRELAADQEARFGDTHPRTLGAVSNLARSLQSAGRLREAEPYAREAWELSQELLGGDSPDTNTQAFNYGTLLRRLGRYDEAQPILERVLEQRNVIFGPNHQRTVSAVEMLAAIARDRDRIEESEPLFRQVLEARRSVLGGADRRTIQAAGNLCYVLYRLERLDEAERLARSTSSEARAAAVADCPETLYVLRNHAKILLAQGRCDDAWEKIAEFRSRAETSIGLDHPESIFADHAEAETLACLGRTAQALALAERYTERARDAFGGEHPEVFFGLLLQAEYLAATARKREAASRYEDALALGERVWPGGSARACGAIAELAVLYEEDQRLEQAEALLVRHASRHDGANREFSGFSECREALNALLRAQATAGED